LITTAYLIVFLVCKQSSKSWRIAAFGALFAGALGFNDWNVRPQGITFLLASLYLLAIQQYQKAKKWGWLLVLPLGMLVWVNSHGTFVVGLVLIGIWVGDELWNLVKSRAHKEPGYLTRRMLIPGITLGITLVACLVNPRGLGIYNYLQTLTGNPAVQNLVTEWAPPTVDNLMGVIFYIALAGCAILFILSPKRPSFSQLFTFLIFGILSLRTARGIVWFGLVIAPFLAEHFAYIIQKYKKVVLTPVNTAGKPVLNYVLFIMIVLVGVITLPWFKNSLPLPQVKAGLISSETPIHATEELLAKNPPGRLFHAISFGSYLIWSAYPEYQVFVDSRIELFPEQVWMDYLTISNASGDWEKLLDQYGVNTMMLSPIEQPALIEASRLSGDWEELYADNTAYVYTRK
jgi:hypothetical protein